MKIFIFCFILLSSFFANGQFKITVVNNTTGATVIAPTIDSALRVANNGDYIYLPGGIFATNLTINKKLFIYGAGHFPDSTSATKKTIIQGNIQIAYPANGGILEGIQVSGLVTFLHGNPQPIENFSIKRCRINDIAFTDANVPQSTLPILNSIEENIIGNILGYGSIENIFIKNIIEGEIREFSNSTFNNNIFLQTLYNQLPLFNITNSTFNNNIFLSTFVISNTLTNIFTNNLTSGTPLNNTAPNSGNINGVAVVNIFKSYAAGSDLYTQDFHLKPNSPGVNAGTDGKDVGIYGTSDPTKEGWVPSNPHISSKNISAKTDANGILKATFKVRAQNN